MDDFFDLEQLLKARVNAIAPELGGRVYAGSEELPEAKGQVPMAFVIYNGFVVLKQAGNQAARLGQNWLIVIVGRHLKDKDGQKTREQVGPIMAKVCKGLMGWEPGLPFSELALENPPEPHYDVNSFGYFPLSFTTNVTIKSDQ